MLYIKKCKIITGMHLDIDGRFGRISNALVRNDAVTLEDLMRVIEGSIEEKIICRFLANVFNVRDWLEPVINDVRYISKPHMFRYVGIIYLAKVIYQLKKY